MVLAIDYTDTNLTPLGCGSLLIPLLLCVTGAIDQKQR